MEPSSEIHRLLEIMRALRDPVSGCPWDVAQSFRSIAPYTLEEAFEVVDAIERGSMAELREELGDLLLQVVFHAQMASEAAAFDFGDVVHAITAKMIRRHPHVFGDAIARSVGAAKGSWERIKSQEKAERRAAEAGELPSLLDDIALALPALTRALKLQERAARVGFDWSEAEPIVAKIEEEVAELLEAQAVGDRDRIEGEFGDLLFSVVNLGRHLKIDPEAALRRTSGKFRDRFRFIERALRASGRSLEAASLDEMEDLWREAKRLE